MLRRFDRSRATKGAGGELLLLLLLLLLLGRTYNFICCKTKMAMAMSTTATGDSGGGGTQCHESTRSSVYAAAIAWEQLQQNSEPAGLTSSTSTIRDGVAAAAGGDLHCGGGTIAAAGASCWELKDWESDITLVSFSLPAAAVPAPPSSIACCSSCDDIITAEKNRSLQAAEVVSVVKTEAEIMLEPEQQQLLHAKAAAAPEALPVLQQLGIKLLERRGVEITNDAELLQQLVSKAAGSSSRTAAAACGVESTTVTSSVSINNAAAAAAPEVQLSTPPLSMTSKRQRVQLDMSSSPAAGTQNVQVPAAAPARCQVEGCTADLSSVLKEYHRRHKVCEMHSKTPNAVVGGRQQRFCQQCSR